jgi:hypothetical protein
VSLSPFQRVWTCPRASTLDVCCSDDAAAWDGGLPAYRDDIPDSAMPLFSAQNHRFSATGMCVDLLDVPCGSGLGQFDGVH